LTVSATARAPAASLERPARSSLLRWENAPAALLLAILCYLVLIPIALLLIASLKPTGLPLDPGWGLDNYVKVYGDPSFYQLIWRTLQFALGCMVGALIVGGLLAWLVERTDLPWRGAARAMILIPMVLPPFLLAMAWIMLASPRTGFVNQLARDWLGLSQAPFDIYTLGGMIFVEVLALTPSTYLILASAFRNMDPALEEAAMLSGARFSQILTRVFLPMLAPAFLAAAAYLLMVGFLVFDVPGTLGMPVGIFVLSSRILYLATDQSGGISAYGMISAIAGSLLAMLLALALVYRRLTRHSSRYVTVSGKGFRPRQLQLGPLRPFAAGFVVLYFLLSCLAPLAILVWTSLMPFQAPVSTEMLARATLANHAATFANTRVGTALWNSIWVSIVSASLVTALALVGSWVVLRTRQPGRPFIDIMMFIPIAIPGTMIGMALVYVYLTLTFVPIYGTAWILVVAYVTVYLSFASRATGSVLIQLHRDLEEAARMSGATPLATLRRILVPLTLPALLGAWIWVVAHVMRELSTALLLQGDNNTTLAVLLFGYWSGGQPTRAAAVGVWLVAIMAVVTVLWQRLGPKGLGDSR